MQFFKNLNSYRQDYIISYKSGKLIRFLLFMKFIGQISPTHYKLKRLFDKKPKTEILLDKKIETSKKKLEKLWEMNKLV